MRKSLTFLTGGLFALVIILNIGISFTASEDSAFGRSLEIVAGQTVLAACENTTGGIVTNCLTEWCDKTHSFSACNEWGNGTICHNRQSCN